VSKRLKPSGEVYRRLKANREENLTKYAGPYMNMQRKKKRKGNDDEWWRQAEKARLFRQ